MTSLRISCHSNARRGFLAVAATLPALAILGAVGCASPGPPRPPSLKLPEVVNDVAAERIGDTVHLHWTTPDTTTDRIKIRDAMTAEICRITVTASTPQTSPCTPVTKLPVQSGPTSTTVTLPQTLTVDPPALLAFRVQIFNIHGHSAGLSREVFVPSGAAPPPVDRLRATPTRDGAMLEWQPSATSAVVELDRLPVGSDGVGLQPASPKTATKSSSKPLAKKPAGTPRKSTSATTKPLSTAPSSPIEVKLRTPVQPTDAGGTIDHTAQMGDTYSYSAQRVRSVTLDGHTLELRSLVAPPVTVVMRSIFPPHSPTGLEAVPGGTTPADRSIDLSWSPNTEDDLAGYIVYRQEIESNGVAAATATRLNATPVVGPAYRDQTAMPGHRYAYRVAAVDTAGNESAPSDAVQETLREQ